MADLTQGIDTPTTGGTEHTLIMALGIGDISTGHSPTLIPTVTEAAILEGTPHALLPATTVAGATPQPVGTPVTPCTVMPSGIVSLHPALTTSPMGTTHTTPWTGTNLTLAAPATQHKNLSPGKSSNAQDPQLP